MTQARSSGYSALDQLLDLLTKAVEQGRLTESQATLKFAEEYEKIQQQINLADLNDFS